MGDDRHFLTGVSNRLGHRYGEVQVLDGLNLEMVVGQIHANHIRGVRRARKLLAAPGVITVGNKFIPPGALTSFPFLA